MNIFVTGGAGYVGSHCVKRLLAAGHAVTVYDNLVHGHRDAVDPRAALIEGDLADGPRLSGLLGDGRYDAVMHFAAYVDVGQSVRQPLRYYRNNVAHTINLLEAMQAGGVRSFVFSSTCAVYGVPDEVPLREDMDTRPISPYGASKLVVEWMLRDCAAAWGLGSIALRYFNASGAADDGSIGEDHEPEIHLIPVVLEVALAKRPHVKVFGTDYPTPDGTCIRDYVHVEDLAEAHLRAVESVRPATAVALNLGTGRGHSVLEIISAAREVTGHAIPIEKTERRPGDPPQLFANADLVQHRLGWMPRQTDIREIIRSAWNWHRTHPNGYNDRAVRPA